MNQQFEDGCVVKVWNDFLPPDLANIADYDQLEFTRPQVRVFGQWHPIPRQQVAYGDPGLHYSFSGSRVAAQEWPEFLLRVKAVVEEKTEHKFNFVLCNRYEPNGKDNIGWHSDDERELAGPIVSVTISEREEGRDFDFRLKKDHKQKIRLRLRHNTCVLFNEVTNQLYQHCIPKRAQGREGGLRINLTFRRIEN